MNTKLTLILIAAMSFAAPAMATNLSADQLVAKSGLSKQEVRMLIGARTPYPAYRTSFERLQKQLIAAVGRKGYDELVAALKEDSSTRAAASAG